MYDPVKEFGFTQEQKDWICLEIGRWYLTWKDRITDSDSSHRLGTAKEELKILLTCDNQEKSELLHTNLVSR